MAFGEVREMPWERKRSGLGVSSHVRDSLRKPLMRVRTCSRLHNAPNVEDSVGALSGGSACTEAVSAQCERVWHPPWRIDAFEYVLFDHLDSPGDAACAAGLQRRELACSTSNAASMRQAHNAVQRSMSGDGTQCIRKTVRCLRHIRG